MPVLQLGILVYTGAPTGPQYTRGQRPTTGEKMRKYHSSDVLIIGSGAAGLTLAHHLASHAKVAVLSKNTINEGATWFAQGGIAAVLDDEDSVEAHVADTLAAGAGLCHEDAVRFTVERSREAIRWLVDQGVNFTRENDTGDFHLTREGGHSHRRIIHSADATGQAVHSTLIDKVQALPNVTIYEHHVAVNLITQADPGVRKLRCTGVYALSKKDDQVHVFQARAVVLATGGASKVYLYTSNPDSASGDGIAMAWRAGCRIANMEFNQFHPTCLFHPDAKSFLISEAVRGEGGRLLLPDGHRFMLDFDPRGELAPRDIVARAIDHEMKRLGINHVWLDISHRSADFSRGHFPTIYRRCLEYGFDMTRQPLPVVPAAHYTCGGVLTDLHARTNLPGLYAIGETAYTGLHGATRLASNSLLECLVFAQAAAENILHQHHAAPRATSLPDWDDSQVTDSAEQVVVSHNWDELRRFMWDYVGIVRTNKRLQRAKRRIELLQAEIQEYYGNFWISNDLLELRNLATVAVIIILSALSRRESRGLHYTLDYPEPDPLLQNQPTVLQKTSFRNTMGKPL